MKHLRTLVCAMAIASLALFTGCGGGDDGGNPSPAPSGSANAPSSIVGKTVSMDNGDSVTASSATDYSATFGGIAESGKYTYSPNGDQATLALTPNDGSASTTLILTFNPDHASGNFTLQETGGTGTFTLH